MAIRKGDFVGPYEVLGRLGGGGMGEVWRARDRRIGRDVAIKVLPESFDARDQRLQRFEQEARAAGALNHPGLVTIFDVGTTEGSPYIVMELLEGQTLREVIGDSEPVPLPLRKAIDYAIQIAEALAVAHEKGIIHRDLKPENLFVMPDQRLKIVDFGLAKLAQEATDADRQRGTLRRLTSAGVAVGTPGYMSPEQVRSCPVDHRTDLFSLGAVLYEMLSGKRAFDGPSAVETMSAVLDREPPPLERVVPAVSPALAAVVGHCLEKNPRNRFQSARDLAFQLGIIQEGASSMNWTPPQPEPARRRPLYFAALAALALLGAGAAAFGLLHSRGTASGLPSSYRQLTFAGGVEIFPSLAPDGKSFAYVSTQSGNRDIYVQRVDGRAAINLTADSPAEDSEPAFSPDGAQIAFRSERDGGGIYVMGASGESARRLTDFGHNPSWSPDAARLVVSTAGTEMKPQVHPNIGELWIIDVRTGAKHVLRNNGTGGDALQPAWSPHGKRIAFWGVSPETHHREIWTIEADAPDPPRTAIRVISAAGANWNPVWSPDGRFLYFGSDRNGTLNLWRIPIDEKSGAATGEAEPIRLPATLSGHFSFSKEGEMAFTSMTRSCLAVTMPFDTTNAALGPPHVLFGGSEEILTLSPSPDRTMIAFTTVGQEDLFVINADGTHLRRLTNDPARDRYPVWSHDGKTIYWYSDRKGADHIWSIHLDGSGLTRVTDERDFQRTGVRDAFVPDVSPDGKTLAVQTEPSATALVHLDRPLGRRLEILTRDLGVPEWSPDGRRLVGSPVDAKGITHAGIAVYSLETKRTVTVLDRGIPQWLPDGRRIAFFQKERSGILDLDTGRITTHPFTPPPGLELDAAAAVPILSPDGANLYIGQTLERSDIWIARP